MKPHFVNSQKFIKTSVYNSWLNKVKQKYSDYQTKAIVKVNSEMLRFYWELGADIIRIQKEQGWGNGVIKQLSLDLRDAYANVQGFSVRNLEYMKRWYAFYSIQTENSEEANTDSTNAKSQQNTKKLTDTKSPQHSTISENSNITNDLINIHHNLVNTNLTIAKSQQTVTISQFPILFSHIPWGHHIEIIYKCKSIPEALFYIKKVMECNWSRETLIDNLKSHLYERLGKAITNYDEHLPKEQSVAAKAMLKTPYQFDFLEMREQYSERDLEDALVHNITRFLLELGQGFAYVGRQMELRMDEQTSFFPDLVFYHYRQKRFVVIELKTKEFIPEYAGKINFYVNAADELLKRDDDNPTVGLLICRSAKRSVVEWSFKGLTNPLGVATYELEKIVDQTFEQVTSNSNLK